jgi:hypothetical protein
MEQLYDKETPLEHDEKMKHGMGSVIDPRDCRRRLLITGMTHGSAASAGICGRLLFGYLDLQSTFSFSST